MSDLTAVGESTVNIPLNAGGAGSFGIGFTEHSARGVGDRGIGTIAVLKKNNVPVAVGLGGYGSVPNGLCTLEGQVVLTSNFEMVAHIKGKLVNQPPTVVLGPKEPVECNGHDGALFELDVSAKDPDDNIASFAWYRDGRTGPQVGTRSAVEIEQPLGTTTYVFKAIDTFGQYADATTEITVEDTTAPTITAPADQEVECTGVFTPVKIGMATALDVCDATPKVTSDAPDGFKLGINTIDWKAVDASNNEAHTTQTVKVIDTKPPLLSVTLSPSVLWSPDHKLVPITATITVSDTCDPKPTVRLVKIESNEPDNGLGDGDTANDIQGISADGRTFKLRAERSGLGNGRIYTVTYEAKDGSGNTTTKTATVTVPKSQGK